MSKNGKLLQNGLRHLRVRGLAWWVIGLALVILGLAMAWSRLQLRQRIREQIAERDGEILHALCLSQQYADVADGEQVSSLADAGEQFNLIMKTSRLKGVLGIRLFAADGKFENAFPAYITEAELPAGDLAKLKLLKPASHFYAQGRLESFDLLAESNSAPVALLVVEVPLHAQAEGRLLGIAQYILQGESIAREYAELDRNFVFQSILGFAGSGSVLALALVLAFRRIQKANRLLAERTASLLRANQELALAAKTSAVGAVTAHLIHGLKNPLSGLQSFVNNHFVEGQPASTDTDWQEAVATTKRMQGLIAQVARVLQEQQSTVDYEMTLEELLQIICARLAPAAKSAGVEWRAQCNGEGVLSNRNADLALLIVDNLAQNAIEATPQGKAVNLTVGNEAGQIVFEVRDEGPGLPAALQGQLFAPCRSTKPGGSGIGLAISKQLANYMGAGLELTANSPNGCTFRLCLPVEKAAEAIPSVADTVKT